MAKRKKKKQKNEKVIQIVVTDEEDGLALLEYAKMVKKAQAMSKKRKVDYIR